MRQAPRRRFPLPFLFVLAIGLSACGPEASRDFGEGEGSGADTGNRDGVVEMHGTEEEGEDRLSEDRVYYETPRRAASGND